MNVFRGLLLFVLLALSGAAAQASNVAFENGTPGWSVANKRCTFLVPGKIVNSDAAGSVSGTLRLCLWVMASPNATSGYRASIYTLGPLRGGYQWSNIKPSATYSIPKLTGNYHYHVSLEEYTRSGWVTLDEGGTSVKTLKSGAFVVPKKWVAPAGKVVAPKPVWKTGEILYITVQGSELTAGAGATVVPAGSQIKLKVKIGSNGTTVVSGGFKPAGVAATYTYSLRQDTHAGKTYPVGYLTLDYRPSTPADARISLFFQGPTKGFYKSADTLADVSATTWGVFSVTR